MVDNLKKLYNTLLLVETRGESTKIMGQCLQFMEQMINDISSEHREEGEKE